jgi:hypothetical protein
VALPIPDPASLVSWYEASTDEVRVVGETSRLPTASQILGPDGTPMSASNPLPVSAAAGSFEAAVELIDETGTAYGVKHVENQPRVVTTEKGWMIAEGAFPSHSALHKFGANDGVIASEAVMMSQKGRINYLAAAEIPVIRSSDVDDKPADTGAFTVVVFGLDANYNEISSTVILDAQNPVPLDKAYLRVFRMYVATAADPIRKNEGIITLYHADNATSLIEIAANTGQSQFGAWTVPAGKTFYMTAFGMTESGAKRALGRIYKRDGSVANSVFRLQEELSCLTGYSVRDFHIPLVFTEQVDIEFTGEAPVPTAQCTAWFEGWYE